MAIAKSIEHTKNDDDKHGIVRREVVNSQGVTLLDSRFPTGRGDSTIRLIQLTIIRRPAPPTPDKPQS